MKRKRLLASALGVLVASAVVGVAFATIPGPGYVYSACMLKGVGTIRLIDKSLPASNLMSHCTDKETEISWNPAGQPGPAGPAGPAGAKGDPGAPGTSGTNGTDGKDGVSVTTASEPAGANCAGGGVQLTAVRGVSYVCNGRDGRDGAGGVGGIRAYCALVSAHPSSYDGGTCRVHIEQLDTFGFTSSITIGSDGNPVVSYSGGSNGLKVAHCSDPACAARTVNTPPVAGYRSSIAIGADGNPVMSSQTAIQVKVTHCSDPACAASTVSTLDSVSISADAYSSIAIGTDGNPVVSYPADSAALMVAHCSDPTCAASTLHALDTFGFATSIAIGTDGNPVVSYRGPSGLTVAHCSDPACAASTPHVLDAVGNYTSVAIGIDGNPVVSYQGAGDALKIAHCSDPACAASTLHTLETASSATAGIATSIAIGTDGNPVVSYRGANSDPRLARCSDSSCAASSVDTLDEAGNYTSVAIGIDGIPIVSYIGPGSALKVARPAILN